MALTKDNINELWGLIISLESIGFDFSKDSNVFVFSEDFIANCSFGIIVDRSKLKKEINQFYW